MKETKPPVIPSQRGNYFYYFGVKASRLYIVFPNCKDGSMALFLTASWWSTACTTSLSHFKPR